MVRISLSSWTAAWHAARHWSTESQARARRNALQANTVLAERRAERDDVDAYLARRDAGFALPQRRRELG